VYLELPVHVLHLGLLQGDVVVALVQGHQHLLVLQLRLEVRHLREYKLMR